MSYTIWTYSSICLDTASAGGARAHGWTPAGNEAIFKHSTDISELFPSVNRHIANCHSCNLKHRARFEFMLMTTLTDWRTDV